MSMMVFEQVWRDLRDRHLAAAKIIDQEKFLKVSQRALDEAAAFGRLPVPCSGHELNLRRIAAYSMTTSWKIELK